MITYDANYITNFLPKNASGIDEALFSVYAEIYGFKLIFAETETCLIKGENGNLLIINSRDSKEERFLHVKAILKELFLEEISCLHSAQKQ